MIEVKERSPLLSSPLEGIAPHFSSESIYDLTAVKHGALLARNGRPIGLYNRGVCAIWGNGADERFVEVVRTIKGEKRGERPLAATLETKTLLGMMDTTKIPESLQSTFANADDLAARIGSLCFIRVPITLDAARSLPRAMLSGVNPDKNEPILNSDIPILQNWDPRGHRPAYNMLREMHNVGIKYPAITSMNVSGEPEIVDQDEGRAFSEEKGIPFFLFDPKDTGQVVGSYTIFNVSSQNGIELVRDGNIPSSVFDTLFETKIDRTNAKQSKYPQMSFPTELTEGLSPSAARIAIISYTKGREIDQIHRAVSAVKHTHTTK